MKRTIVFHQMTYAVIRLRTANISYHCHEIKIHVIHSWILFYYIEVGWDAKPFCINIKPCPILLFRAFSIKTDPIDPLFLCRVYPVRLILTSNFVGFICCTRPPLFNKHPHLGLMIQTWDKFAWCIRDYKCNF